MKVKELIRKLKEFDENLIVTIGDDCRAGAMVYNKEHTDMVQGSLKTVETLIGDYIAFEKDSKGKYLMLDISKSEVFTQDDFKK